jgi:hypothetical protein
VRLYSACRIPALASAYCGSVLIRVRAEDADPSSAGKKKAVEVAHKAPIPPVEHLPDTAEHTLRVLLLAADELPAASHGEEFVVEIAVRTCIVYLKEGYSCDYMKSINAWLCPIATWVL